MDKIVLEMMGATQNILTLVRMIMLRMVPEVLDVEQDKHENKGEIRHRTPVGERLFGPDWEI